MKTINDIKLEILNLKIEGKNLGICEGKEHNKINKRLKYLNEMFKYIETAPREEFLKDQLKTLCDTLEDIDSNFDEWRNNTPKSMEAKNPLAVYRTQMGRKNIIVHKKNIEFILS